jgi:hypothetical protein
MELLVEVSSTILDGTFHRITEEEKRQINQIKDIEEKLLDGEWLPNFPIYIGDWWSDHNELSVEVDDTTEIEIYIDDQLVSSVPLKSLTSDTFQRPDKDIIRYNEKDSSYVLRMIHSENGTTGYTIDIEDFDISKLSVSFFTINPQLNEGLFIDCFTYDGNDLENNGSDTTGKYFDVDIIKLNKGE